MRCFIDTVPTVLTLKL